MNRIKRFLDYIYVLALLIAGGTPILSLHYKETIIIVFAFSLLMLILNHNHLKKNDSLKPLFFVCIIMIVSILLSCIVNGDSDFTHYIGIALLFLISYLAILCMSFARYKKVYINLFLIIAIYSIVLTVYSNLNHAFAAGLPELVSKTDGYWRTFHYIYNLWAWDKYSNLYRNSALFREPGVYAAYSSLALLFLFSEKNILKNKSNTIKFVIILLGTLSTLSTTGIVISVLCFILFLTKLDKKKRKIIVITGGVAIVIIAYVFRDLLFSKFSSSSYSYISFLERHEGLTSGLQIWSSNVLFGKGFTYFNENILGTSSNSYISVLGRYGIIPFVFLVRFIIISSKQFSSGFKTRLLILLIIALNLWSQFLILYPAFLCLFFYSYTELNKNKHLCVVRRRIKRITRVTYSEDLAC